MARAARRGRYRELSEAGAILCVMSDVRTAAVVLDGFLAARAASTATTSTELDREVVGWLRDSLEARDLGQIDDLTAYLLSHSTGRLPTDRELEAVLTVVEGIPDFFRVWLPERVGAAPDQVAHAAIVVRLLARWLLARQLVDVHICEHLARFTSVYESLAETPIESGRAPARG